MRTLTLLLLIIASTMILHAQEVPFWTQTNGPIGPAFVGAPTMTPDGKLFITSSRLGGIYCSDDTGRNFHLCNVGAEKVQTISSTFSVPYNSDTVLFLGTTTQALYRSTDHGRNWKADGTGFPPNLFVHTTTLASPNSRTVFHAIYAGGLKIVRSTDDGASWGNWLASYSNPLSLNMVVTTTGAGMLTVDGRLFRTTDAGVTWNEGGKWPLRADVSWTPLVAGVGNTFFTAELRDSVLRRSTDLGATWSSVSGLSQTARIEDLRASPDGRLIALFDDFTLYLSNDTGRTWQQFASIPTPPYLNNSYAYAMLIGETIIVQNFDFTLWRSSDMGKTWSQTPFDVYPSTTSMALVEEPNGAIITADIYGEFYRTTDRGDSWQQVGKITQQAGEGVVGLDRDQAGLLFAGTFGLNGGSVYRSSDGGTTWKVVTIGLSSNARVSRFAFLGGDTILIATNNGIFRSTNNGDSWTQVGSSSLPTLSISSIVRTRSGTILIATNGNGFWASTDAGTTWHDRNDAHVTDATVGVLRHMHGDTVFASGGVGGIYRTTNDGVTWKRADVGIPLQGIDDIVEDSSGVFYVGTGLSPGGNFGLLMRSTDHGTTWSLVTMMPITDYRSLLVSHDGYLYGSTDGWGVWRSVKSSILSVPGDRVEADGIELRVVGNMIHYRLVDAAHVVLVLYDALGREVRVLASDQQEAGEHTLNLDGSSLSSGIYFLRLVTTDRSATVSFTITH